MKSGKLFVFSNCEKSLYVYINNTRTLSELITLFDNSTTLAITLTKNIGSCYIVNRVDNVTADYIIANNNINSNIVPYSDTTIDTAFSTLDNLSFIVADLNVKLSGSTNCDCNNKNIAYFRDICANVVYGVNIETLNFIELNPSYIYRITKESGNVLDMRACTYIVNADSYELIQIQNIEIIHNLPIEKYSCDGLYTFESCKDGSIIRAYVVNGELGDKGSYYKINNQCYRFVGNESGFEQATDDEVTISEQYEDCDCNKGSLVFRTCNGDLCFETSNYTDDLVFTTGHYYQLSDYAWFNIDGKLYKNCCEFVGYSKDVDVTINTEFEPNINNISECDNNECNIYFESTLTSCNHDFEQIVYVNSEVSNYMLENGYESFSYSREMRCLILPYGRKPVTELLPNIPRIELENISEFYRDCDECFDKSEYTCFVIHPCDGSKDVYITKSEQCVMSEDVDELEQFDGRYVSFNYFGKIMCGYVERNCSAVTNEYLDKCRTITKENIIECYFSCAECNDSEDEKAKQRETEPVIKLGIEVEPNYEVNDSYCKKHHKTCCCDDD